MFFAYLYSAWKRGINERTNRIFRKFVPKGKSIHNFTNEQILIFADEMNATLRKRLGYCTPEELLEK